MSTEYKTEMNSQASVHDTMFLKEGSSDGKSYRSSLCLESGDLYILQWREMLSE